MEQLFDILDVFLQNSKVASLFFLILMMISPWTQRYFTQTWHYVALRVNALLFFLPLAPICEKIAPYLVNILPIIPKTEVILPETVGNPWYVPVDYFGEMGEIDGTVGADFISTAEANPVNWAEMFLLLWVIGSIISLIWHGYCRIRLEKELKPLIPLENPEIHTVLEQCKLEKKIKARIKLFSSHKLYSPLLVGLFQGKILFPNKKMEEKHLEYIFSHELTHLKRGDLWWKALLTPLTVIFWWNPLIYYFMAQFELRLEYSCDEKVVGKSSIKERKSYGLAILESINEKKQEKLKLFGVSLRTPEQKLERRLKNMLKFSEMKTKTKILSGVLMSAMLLGAAAPSVVKSVEEYKINPQPHLMNYEEFHLNQGFSSDSIQQYPELDTLLLTDITIHELMTEEYLLQLAFWGELELPRHGEYGKQTHDWEGQTWITPVEITYTDGTKEDTNMTGFISGGGAFGTSYDLSVHTQIQKKDVSTITYLGTDFKLLPSHSTTEKEGETYPELSSSELDKVFLYYSENECTGEIRTNVKVIETTGEELIVVSLYTKSGELMMSYDRGETWELASEDDWNYWMDAGEIELLQEGSQGIEIVPIEVFPTVEQPEREVEIIYGETVLGSLEDDVGFHDFEAYHPETGELMTLTEWTLYEEEQLRVNRDIYAFLEEAYYVTSEEKPYFTEEHWAIILETAKTRENFYFETEQDYINYLLEAGLISY